MRSVTALAAGISLTAVLTAPAWGPGPREVWAQQNPVRSIAPLEAKKLIETTESLQLVDVRTRQEYLNGALPGSKLVPWSSWSTKDFLRQMEAFEKDKPLLLVCAVGGRSWAAANLLSRAGFREVYNLNGGLQAWAMQRVPLPQSPAATGK